MDFMKVFDQTVREIKREVNLKVLKVPELEQKLEPGRTLCASLKGVDGGRSAAWEELLEVLGRSYCEEEEQKSVTVGANQ